MQKDLDMNQANNGYSITSLVFFITYTIFQIPATVIIRKVGPRIFLSSIVILWGAVMLVGFTASEVILGPLINTTHPRHLVSSQIGRPWLGCVSSSAP
jgi:hypothetical protein